MLLQKRSAQEMVISVLGLNDEKRLKVVIMLLYAWWEANNNNAGEGLSQIIHRATLLAAESRPRLACREHRHGLGHHMIFSR